MKKYVALLKIALTRSFTYRAQTLLWIALDIFPTLITMLTWIAIYHGANHALPLSISQLLLYYLAMLLIVNVTETHFEEDWVDEIRYGNVDFLFTKPINFILYMVVIEIADKFLAIVSFTIPVIVLAVALMSQGTLQFPPLSAPAIGVFSIFLVFAFCMNCLFSALVSLAAFWFEESRSLAHFKWMVAGVLGGGIAPLVFYPQMIRDIARYFPFERMSYLPATIFSQQTLPSSVGIDLAILFGFVIVGMIIVQVVWRAAVKKYTSAGG